MKIGIVDLDTSHPQNWIPIEREMGHEIVGIWDGGAVHPRKYVEDFAKERDIPLYESLEELAKDSDTAILHGCDWDTRIEKARPFVEAGKSVLLDKPLAGNLRDLRQITAWVQNGARISGGSSLFYCYEVQRWLAQPVAERGTPQTVFCGCGVDDFNYGIHAYSLLCSLMGQGARSVRYLGTQGQSRIQIAYEDGRVGWLVIGKAEAYLPFYATLTTERSVTHLQVDNSGLYRALLEQVLPYLAGETDTPPLPLNFWIEPELCAIAALQSREAGGADVPIPEIQYDFRGYDGAAFAEEYRRMRYPKTEGD